MQNIQTLLVLIAIKTCIGTQFQGLISKSGNFVPIETIVSSFEKAGPVPCIALISDHSFSLHHDLSIPVYQMDPQTLNDMEYHGTCRSCGHAILVLKDEANLSYLERLTQGGFWGQNQITNFIIWGHTRCYPMPFSPKIRVLALKLASRGQFLEYGSFQWF